MQSKETILNKSSNISFNMKNKEIIFIKYKLSHDGYDCYGPQSNIYDINIIIKENNDYILYNYHKEDWYSSCDNDYYLDYMIKLSELSNSNLHLFPKLTSENDIILYNAYFEKISTFNLI